MRALIIGRFQPFHNGHLSVIKETIATYEYIHIGIGSSQYEHTSDNPFSYHERKQMIDLALRDENITQYAIHPIPDIHDPPHWVNHVLQIISDFDVVITNSPTTQQLFQAQGYPVETTGFFQRDQYNASTIRSLMRNQKNWRHLVPKSVASYLEEIDGITRLESQSSLE